MTLTRAELLKGLLALTMLVVGCGESPTDKDRRFVQEWNNHRRTVACTTMNGDHRVCSDTVGGFDDQDRPYRTPEGYKAVFYTSGCPTCAVGWVLKKGKCDEEPNCYD